MLTTILPALVAAWHWVLANQDQLAALGCLLLPSLITGLSKHPTPATNELIEGLQILLGRLSVLHHSDSPATLKAPWSKPVAPASLDKPAPAQRQVNP